MICDLAETYHIYNYEQLPVEKVAVFVCGLREKARVWQKFGQHDFDRELLTLIYDKINWIAWTKTESAHNGQAPPDLLFPKLFPDIKKNNDDTVGFKSAEDFNKEWEKIANGNNNS